MLRHSQSHEASLSAFREVTNTRNPQNFKQIYMFEWTGRFSTGLDWIGHIPEDLDGLPLAAGTSRNRPNLMCQDCFLPKLFTKFSKQLCQNKKNKSLAG